MTRRHEEHDAQVALAAHLRLRARRDVWWSSLENHPRSRVAGALGRARGVRSGLPDLVLVRSGKFYGLELKGPGGRLSQPQRLQHAAMREAGCEIATVFGIDAALQQLAQWKLLR
jgi:hypothetical protein